MKLPRSRPMSRNSTTLRPSWMALPISEKGTRVPAPESPMAPLEVEVAHHLGKHAGIGHQVAVELKLQPQVDDGLRGHACLDADVPHFRKAQEGVARVAPVLDVHGKGGPQMGVTAGLSGFSKASSCRKPSCAREADAGQGHVGGQLQLIGVAHVQIEALLQVHAEAEGELPVDVHIDGTAGLQPEARDPEIEVDARAHIQEGARRASCSTA